MRVEQAMYGSSRGGHAMLAASGLNDVALDLTSRLDLPDTTPTGVSWSPYLTGFPIGPWYVFARTCADVEANRAGMVFSHALIAPLQEVIRFDDLLQITALLAGAPSKPHTLDHLELNAAPRAQTPLDPEDLAIIDLLISSQRKPIVRVGIEGFDDVITRVWRALWPELRLNFAFRMSFGPNDVVEDPPPSLICTPAKLTSRWSGFPSPQSKPAMEGISPATFMLIGSDQGQPVRALTRSLGLQVGKFSELSLLNRLQDLYSLGARDLTSQTAKLRLIEVLSNGRVEHAVGRDDLIAETVASLSEAAVKQVRSFRNLELAAFEKADAIWSGLKEWTSNFSFPAAEDQESIELVMDAYVPRKALPRWQSAIKGGLAQAKTHKRAVLSHAFWRFLALCESSRVPVLMEAFAADRTLEETIVEASPLTLVSEGVDSAMKQAATLGLLKLHAVLAAARSNPMEAAQSQLHLDPTASDPAALRLSVRRALPSDLITIALVLQQSTFLDLAASSAATDPQLLADLDVAEITAQDLWSRTLQRNLAAWKGPRDPRAARNLVLDQVISGQTSTSSQLVELLSETPLASLRAYRRRRDLWSNLKSTTKQRFLSTTAQDFLKGIDEHDVLPLEPEVQDHILRSTLLSNSLRMLISTSVGKAVRLISELSHLSDPTFRLLAPLFTSVHFSTEDANSLGRIIRERRWRQSAEYFVPFANHDREDVRALLRECQTVLSFWDRLPLGLGSIDIDEKWNSYAELASSLYPEGPNDREVWQRAGGKNSDLIYYGDSRQRWYDAVSKIRRGYPPRVWELISKMREDFIWNADLLSLANDPEFRRAREY